MYAFIMLSKTVQFLPFCKILFKVAIILMYFIDLLFSFPGGCGSQASGGPSQAGGAPPTEETEAEMQEQQEEADNPELIARRRGMDEYKDDHRRGEGNRHNRS
jgi:hypothetical protein